MKLHARSSAGFTLLEVILALGIAGGGLVLVVSACNEGLRRTIRADMSQQLDELCERKLNEILAGAEQAVQGPCAQRDTWLWKLETEMTEAGALRLERLHLSIHDTSAAVVLKRLTTLRQRAGAN
jgi:type II secretory pathway pseudopilin PulG